MTWPMTCYNNGYLLHYHTVVIYIPDLVLKPSSVLCSALMTHNTINIICSSHIPSCLATPFPVTCFQLEALVLVSHCTVVLMLSETKLLTMVWSSWIQVRKHAIAVWCALDASKCSACRLYDKIVRQTCVCVNGRKAAQSPRKSHCRFVCTPTQPCPLG